MYLPFAEISAIVPSPDTAANFDLCSLLGYVQAVTSVALKLAGGVAVVMMLWGGLQYGLAFGDEGKIGKAKGIITAAIIGLIIMFAAIALVTTVWNVLLQNGNPRGNQASFLSFITGRGAIGGCTAEQLNSTSAADGTDASSLPPPGVSEAEITLAKQAAADAYKRKAQDLRAHKQDPAVIYKDGPCLGKLTIAGNWALDIAHNPRTAGDGEPANQCSGYQHFIELSPDGQFIKAGNAA